MGIDLIKREAKLEKTCLDLTVRHLEPRDLQSFSEAAKCFFYESDHSRCTLDIDKFVDLVEKAMGFETVAFPAVFDKETVVAYAIINYSIEYQDEPEGDLAQLYVLPEYRGTVVSRLLAQAIVDQFDAWGCVFSHLFSAPGIDHDGRAVAVFKNLFQKYGYKQSGIIMTREAN